MIHEQFDRVATGSFPPLAPTDLDLHQRSRCSAIPAVSTRCRDDTIAEPRLVSGPASSDR